MDNTTITLCHASYFNNMAQRFPYMVLDLRLRRTQCLKNTMPLHFEDVNKAVKLSCLNEFAVDQKLYSNRKRLFNYCLPCSTESQLSIEIGKLIKSHLHEIEECFTVSLDEVVQVVETCRDSTDYEEFKAALKLATMFKKEHIQEFIILIEPGDEIFRTYPILDINTISLVLMKLDFPNEIIKKQIYLGNAEQAKNLMLLQALGITHIVNAAKEVKNYHPTQFKYYNIRILDEDKEPISDYFDEASLFIEAASKEGRILVHCAQGRSRSACIVVLILMRRYQLPFEEAYQIVQTKREIVRINDGFQKQLQ